MQVGAVSSSWNEEPAPLPEPAFTTFSMRPRPAPPAVPAIASSPDQTARVAPLGINAASEITPRSGPPPHLPRHKNQRAELVRAAEFPSDRVVRPAAQYRCIDDLCIITCYFNPENYHTRRHNFARFSQSIRQSGIAMTVVECAIGDRPFELGNEPDIVRARAHDVMWHKENLLNLAIAGMPRRYTKLAWVDCDVLFENPDWFIETSSLLDRYPIVQPFHEAFRLRPNSDVFWGEGERYYSFAAIHSVFPNISRAGDFHEHGHTGFAWAVRRDVIERIGLYDAALAGNGDHLMAHAFCGDFRSPCLTGTFRHNEAHLTHFKPWAEAAWEAVRGRLGFVPGALLHLWHGEHIHRSYYERSTELANQGFNPVRDLEKDAAGMWQWGRGDASLRRWGATYFARRREDDHMKETGEID